MTDAPHFCGACGQPVDPAQPLCPHCGAALSAPLPPPPPAVPVPAAALANGETNGFAIASLVLGILWLYWLGSILAIVFGHIALVQIRRRQGNSAGRGMAIAGLVLGYIGIAIAILIIALVLSLPIFFHGHFPGRGIVV
ncbi:MAG: DUF4190 domain-containing protein [Acidobacteria bacterium]|nr:MAG: DUF4190 domain-containing protein [Acidobacteriota bacterium]